MIECETKTRKWGNSLGITIPKELLESEGIKEDEIVKVIVLKPNQVLRKSFGMLKKKVSAQKIKNELRKELHNE